MKKKEPGRKSKIRSIGNVIAVVGSLFAVALFTGRRKPVSDVIHHKVFSENLDQYLKNAEANYTDLTAGTEKTIVWADSAKQKTRFSFVYLHGFSATRQETYPLSDQLAERLGANLFYTRLSGHGRTGDAMGQYTANDWLNDADEALAIGRQIGEEVIVIGTSTGGTLATWLAARENTEGLAAMILISPNYWVRASGAGVMLWPWGKQILHVVQGASYEWEPANERHAQFWTYRYPSVALLEMMKLLDYVNGMAFEEIKTPALVIYSPEDQVVDPEEIKSAYARFGSEYKQIVVIEDAEDRNNHVLAGEILAPGATEKVADLIYTFLGEIDIQAP